MATATVRAPHSVRHFDRLPSDVGRLLVTRLVGPHSGVSLRVWVWLPPQYDQPAYAHDTFPALMLYPGGTGAGHNGWVGPQLGAQELVAAQSVPPSGGPGSVLPFVLVMPEMQVSPVLDTECADLPGEPAVGTFLAQDVREMVLDSFRVSPDRVSWGAAGTSSGAYCAMRIVFTHPDEYAAVVSIDGYFTIDTPLPGAHDPAVLATDPQEIARTRPPQVSVLLWSGTSGHDLARSRHFLGLVRSPTSVELRDIPGAQHLTVDMARMVPDSFTFLSRRLAPPAPLVTGSRSPSPSPSPSAAGVVHVVGLGDSVPAGNACGCTSYVGLVGEGLARRTGADPDAVNLAQSGLTTAELLDQLAQADVEAAVARADLVIVTIGANDFPQDRATDPSCAPPDLDCYQDLLTQEGAQVAQVVDRVVALQGGAGGHVVLTGYWNVFLDGTQGRARGAAYTRTSDALTRADNLAISAAAAARGARYVDVYTAFKGDGSRDDTALLADDGDHPNAAGHRVIADAILTALPGSPSH